MPGLPQLGKISELLSHASNSVTAVTAFATPGTGGVPASNITNRASLPDITKSLQTRWGIERVMVQSIEQASDESALANTVVWKGSNDIWDRVRFVGDWHEIADSNGFRIQRRSSNTTAFCEIIFYGTGLRLLSFSDGSSGGTSIQASVDGGGASEIMPTSQSVIIQGRGYSPLNCIKVTQNLTDGWHVVKLRAASGSPFPNVAGFDIIHSNANDDNLRIEAGEIFHKGSKYVLEAQTTPEALSAFEAGALVTKGGNVVVYLKDDGTVAKAVNPVNESSGLANAISNAATSFIMQATPPADWQDGTILEIDDGAGKRELVVVASIVSTTVNIKGTIQTTGGFGIGATALMYGQSGLATDRTNEAEITTYHPREFSSGITDAKDYGNLDIDVPDSIAHTLADNGSILNGTNNLFLGTVLKDPLTLNTTADVVVFNFVGTGVSFRLRYSTASPDEHEVYVDGVKIDKIPDATSTLEYVLPIVSDLPYGSHVVRIRRNATGGGVPGLVNYLVYGTKEPTVSTDYPIIASYNILGNFKSTADLPSTLLPEDQIARGVRRKHNLREFEYREGTGGTANWTMGSPTLTSIIGGFRPFTDRTGADLVKLQFFGTGFELRTRTTASNSGLVPMTLNGLAITTANFPGISVEVRGIAESGGLGTSGILDLNNTTLEGASYTISGLDLDNYTLGMGNSTAGAFIEIWCVDVICPLTSAHTGKFGVSQGSEFRVGSTAIKDQRKFTFAKGSAASAISRTRGFQDTVTQTGTIGNSNQELIPGMGTYHVSASGRIRIDAQMNFRGTVAGGSVIFHIQVDGIAVYEANTTIQVMNEELWITVSEELDIAPGGHWISFHWHYNSAGAVSSPSGRRELRVRDVSKMVQLQEDIVNE